MATSPTETTPLNPQPTSRSSLPVFPSRQSDPEFYRALFLGIALLFISSCFALFTALILIAVSVIIG